MTEFSLVGARKLQNKELNNKNKNFNELKNTPLIAFKQCLFILNLHAEVLFFRGIQNMLGYSEAEFNMGNISNKIHPEDKLMVHRIINNSLALAVKVNIKNKHAFLTVSFRIKKRDGNYIKVMSKSFPFQTDEAGKLVNYLTILTDISFMNTKNIVEWDVFSDDLNVSLFKEKIYSEYSQFFSKRELEIVQLINCELTTKQIALKTHISPHTVVSHRKNIFKKTNCHSVKELIAFCKKNGII